MIGRSQVLVGVLWVVAVLPNATANAPNFENANSVLGEVRTKGASAVVRSLWDSPDAWDRVMKNIKSGDRAWIDVALSLRAGSDAGATSELHSAMFLALSKNPVYVLRVVELTDRPPYQSFLLSDVCEGRVDPPLVYQEAIAELERARVAVRNVQKEDLRSKKQMCLARLREGEKNLQRMFGVTGK